MNVKQLLNNERAHLKEATVIRRADRKGKMICLSGDAREAAVRMKKTTGLTFGAIASRAVLLYEKLVVEEE